MVSQSMPLNCFQYFFVVTNDLRNCHNIYVWVFDAIASHIQIFHGKFNKQMNGNELKHKNTSGSFEYGGRRLLYLFKLLFSK